MSPDLPGNPFPDSMGEHWARSEEGERTLATVLAQAGIEVETETRPKPPRRLWARWVVPAAALALIAATIVALQWGDSNPVARHTCAVTGPSAAGFTPSVPGTWVFDEPAGQAVGPPRGFDAIPALGPDWVWFGSQALWTVIRVDGTYPGMKSVWWSDRFPGGLVEEAPELSVTGRRLDGEATIEPEHPTTNGWTFEDGWFMIADFPIELPAGCWEITGSYKEAELSFVVDVE